MLRGLVALSLLAALAGSPAAEAPPYVVPADTPANQPARERTLEQLSWRLDLIRQRTEREEAASTAVRQQVIFLLTVCAIASAMSFGLSVWSCFLQGRRSKLP
jgi:hypothetical protein